MNIALLNAFNIYCVTLTGMLLQKCSISDDFDMDSSMVVLLISVAISNILVGVFMFSHFRTE